jgi:hypothetical protein
VKVFKKYGWRKIAVIQVGGISFDLAEVSLKKIRIKVHPDPDPQPWTKAYENKYGSWIKTFQKYKIIY